MKKEEVFWEPDGRHHHFPERSLSDAGPSVISPKAVMVGISSPSPYGQHSLSSLEKIERNDYGARGGSLDAVSVGEVADEQRAAGDLAWGSGGLHRIPPGFLGLDSDIYLNNKF
ncbi:hypothetical protein CRG98_008619 [Punica granatum]|uniref:Uncharacterized protein n=1 Tax=Punica granatum TaxID=22663 RepID=A0A2I0KRB4_PUNGR|nr:hypothetical protein CRG98_008619 [Punica granatum]